MGKAGSALIGVAAIRLSWAPRAIHFSVFLDSIACATYRQVFDAGRYRTAQALRHRVLHARRLSASWHPAISGTELRHKRAASRLLLTLSPRFYPPLTPRVNTHTQYMAPKRRHDDTMKPTPPPSSTTAAATIDPSAEPSASTSPFIPIFETFRAELDTHHDRRERITKASRDITAASKKVSVNPSSQTRPPLLDQRTILTPHSIFALQRARTIGAPLPPAIAKATATHHAAIRAAFAAAAPDLHGPLALRYARQISPGLQEWAEARLFQVYIERGGLWGYEEARAEVRALLRVADTAAQAAAAADGDVDATRKEDDDAFDLPMEDYLLGVYDMTGELMRFAITTMATSGALPALPTASTSTSTSTPPRTLLTDLRQLSQHLLALDASPHTHFGRDAESKAKVMLASVDKVERALYGLVVRGSERPKGWMPDADGGGRRPEEVESW